MSRPLSIVGAAALLAAACSHEQKIAAKPSTPAKVAQPAAKPVKMATAEPEQPAPAGAKQDAIYFDFDSSLLRADARPVLEKVADEAKAHNASLQIEGNCDEVGTIEYNLALGDHRAKAAKDYLVRLGVPGDRIGTISYGSERPRFEGHDEEARAKNRRDDLLLR
jgi:peptidoglycan-associated lipoprotein